MGQFSWLKRLPLYLFPLIFISPSLLLQDAGRPSGFSSDLQSEVDPSLSDTAGGSPLPPDETSGASGQEQKQSQGGQADMGLDFDTSDSYDYSSPQNDDWMNSEYSADSNSAVEFRSWEDKNSNLSPGEVYVDDWRIEAELKEAIEYTIFRVIGAIICALSGRRLRRWMRGLLKLARRRYQEIRRIRRKAEEKAAEAAKKSAKEAEKILAEASKKTAKIAKRVYGFTLREAMTLRKKVRIVMRKILPSDNYFMEMRKMAAQKAGDIVDMSGKLLKLAYKNFSITQIVLYFDSDRMGFSAKVIIAGHRGRLVSFPILYSTGSTAPPPQNNPSPTASSGSSESSGEANSSGEEDSGEGSEEESEGIHIDSELIMEDPFDLEVGDLKVRLDRFHVRFSTSGLRILARKRLFKDFPQPSLDTVGLSQGDKQLIPNSGPPAKLKKLLSAKQGKEEEKSNSENSSDEKSGSEGEEKKDEEQTNSGEKSSAPQGSEQQQKKEDFLSQLNAGAEGYDFGGVEKVVPGQPVDWDTQFLFKFTRDPVLRIDAKYLPLAAIVNAVKGQAIEKTNFIFVTGEASVAQRGVIATGIIVLSEVKIPALAKIGKGITGVKIAPNGVSALVKIKDYPLPEDLGSLKVGALSVKFP